MYVYDMIEVWANLGGSYESRQKWHKEAQGRLQLHHAK